MFPLFFAILKQYYWWKRLLRTGNDQKSFEIRGASLWDKPALDAKMASSINAFKYKLKENKLQDQLQNSSCNEFVLGV